MDMLGCASLPPTYTARRLAVRREPRERRTPTRPSHTTQQIPLIPIHPPPSAYGARQGSHLARPTCQTNLPKTALRLYKAHKQVHNDNVVSLPLWSQVLCRHPVN